MFPPNLYARVPLFAVCIGTRDRGCGAHPVFPAPSDNEGGKLIANLGQIMPRDREVICSRHCERSEAIHVSASCAMDCFAALAMAGKQPGSDRRSGGPHLALFTPKPFPLRPKTLYGAARFAIGEI